GHDLPFRGRLFVFEPRDAVLRIDDNEGERNLVIFRESPRIFCQFLGPGPPRRIGPSLDHDRWRLDTKMNDWQPLVHRRRRRRSMHAYLCARPLKLDENDRATLRYLLARELPTGGDSNRQIIGHKGFKRPPLSTEIAPPLQWNQSGHQ